MKTVEVLRKLTCAFRHEDDLMYVASRVCAWYLYWDGDVLMGDTYKIRARLAELGGLWIKRRKGWRMPTGMGRVTELLLTREGLEAAAGNEQDLAAIIAYLRGFWTQLGKDGPRWAGLLKELRAAIREDDSAGWGAGKYVSENREDYLNNKVVCEVCGKECEVRGTDPNTDPARINLWARCGCYDGEWEEHGWRGWRRRVRLEVR